MDHSEENRGGHAIHFLKRLERASGEAAELALRLYHDPQLLRAALFTLRIPEPFERAAFSLHSEDRGPYLVASREGRFITCLGRNMSIQGLHLVPYARLLAHIHKEEQTRERFAVAESIVGKGNEMNKLLKRILTNGADVTREEFLGLSAVQPVAKIQFICALFEAVKTQDTLGRYLHTQKILGRKEAANLRTYWDAHWATGHLALLASMSGMQGLEAEADMISKEMIRHLVALLFTGDISIAARALWSVGKMGLLFLPELKRLMAEPAMAEHWVLGFFGAALVGLRHGKLHSQVKDALVRSMKSAGSFHPHVASLLVKAAKKPSDLLNTVCGIMEFPDRETERYLALCRQCLFIEKDSAPKLAASYPWKSEDEIPKDLAFTWGGTYRGNFFKTPNLLIYLAMMLPRLAECNAEDFYFPHEFYKHFQRPWSVEDSIHLIQCDREAHEWRATVVAEKTPGRNDPCSCGSGKKYKKCCLQGKSDPERSGP